MEQQRTVPAAHHAKAEAYEADRAVAQIVGFPPAAGHMARAEQGVGDVAIASVLKLTVEGAQPKDQPVPACLRQGCGVRTEIATREVAPEACRGGDTYFKELIERQQHGR